MKQHVILGGPGCGKTRRLMDILDKELAGGVRPQEIAFVAFTRKAAHEARERAMQRFGLSDEDLPYFRTLHSLAFRQLALNTSEVMGDNDFKAIGQALNLQFGATDEDLGTPLARDNKGDQISYLEQISRLTGKTLEAVCSEFKMQSYWEVLRYRDTLRDYKRSRRMFDFTDMLEMFLESADSPPCKVIFIDEAQDLSPLQWRICEQLTRHAERVYIAGDDDQAIYEWSGADVATFLRLQGQVEVLPVSHRLSKPVFAVASDVLSRIKQRFPKVWQPRDGDTGGVFHYSRAESVDFSEGTWYLLARNRYMLPELVTVLRESGFPYLHFGKSSVDNDSVKALGCWEALRKGGTKPLSDVKVLFSKLRAGAVEGNGRALLSNEGENSSLLSYEDLTKRHGLKLQKDEDWMTALRLTDREREYYRAIRRRGESLVKYPRITVSTIHQVKGGEAQHVLLKTDMSNACHESLYRNPDSEHRVFYVGATRAKETLHVLYPKTNKSYRL